MSTAAETKEAHTRWPCSAFVFAKKKLKSGPDLTPNGHSQYFGFQRRVEKAGERERSRVTGAVHRTAPGAAGVCSLPWRPSGRGRLTSAGAQQGFVAGSPDVVRIH